MAMAAKALDQKRAIGLGVAVEVSSTGQLLDRRSVVYKSSFPKIEVPELIVKCGTADATADTLFTVISPKRDPFNSVVIIVFVCIEDESSFSRAASLRPVEQSWTAAPW